MSDPGDEVVVQVIGLISGNPSVLAGQWLVEYDPTRDGTGPNGEPMSVHLVCSPDRADARRFTDAAAAAEMWRAPSGRPYPADRPLTAYNVLIERVNDDGQR